MNFFVWRLSGIALAFGLSLQGLTASASPQVSTFLITGDEGETRALCREFVCQDLFGANEQQHLRELGATASLAQSVQVGPLDAHKSAQLERALKTKFKKLKLERREVAKPQSEALFKNYQWGLWNQGISQRLAIDDLNSTWITGVVGEDIGLLRAPPEVGRVVRKVRVAVLDTGVDLTHPDLAPSIAQNSAECAALSQYKSCLTEAEKAPGDEADTKKEQCDNLWAKVDADGNGYPLDCSGWNLTAGKNPLTGIMGSPIIEDDGGHGSHVSGVIADPAQPSVAGYRGTSQSVELIPIQVIRTSPNAPIRPQSDDLPPSDEASLRWPSGFTDVIARGFLYAIKARAEIIHLSLAWPGTTNSPIMSQIVELATKRGILVVAAAGNDSTDSRVLPCAFNDVICVGAYGPDGKRSHFSNGGSFVETSAPGLRILSTWPMHKPGGQFTAVQGYEYKNGTSMAAPFVTGMLARLMAEGQSPAEARARILISGRPPTAEEIQATPFAIPPRADLARALEANPSPLIEPSEKKVINLFLNGQGPNNATIPFQVSLKNRWMPLTSSEKLTVRFAMEVLGFRPQSLTIQSWASGEVKSFPLTLPIHSATQLPGRLELKVTIEHHSNAGAITTTQHSIPLEVANAISSQSAPLNGERWPLVGFNWTPHKDLRKVRAVVGDDSSEHGAVTEFVLMEPDPSFRPEPGKLVPFVFEFLRRDPRHQRYVKSGQARIELAMDAVFLQIDRTDPQTRELLFKISPAANTKQFRMERISITAPTPASLDSVVEFTVTSRVIHDNQASVLPERFQWIKFKNEWTPAWIATGRLPESEKPTRDTWDEFEDKPAADPVDSRFYLWTKAGLRTLTAPKKYFWIEVLSPSTDEERKGTRLTLLGSGDSYSVDYAHVTIDNPQDFAAIPTPTPFALESFRMLMGIRDIQRVYDPTRPDRGNTVFNLGGPRGGLRSTWLTHESHQVTGTRDFFFDAAAPGELSGSEPGAPLITDSVMRLSGLLHDARGTHAFLQTHYWLDYYHLESGQRARISLDRFSFLPSFIFNRGFFPFYISSEQPAVLVPGVLGTSLSTEIIVPSLTSGTAARWDRPAAFRFQVSNDCEEVAEPMPATRGESARWTAFCTSGVIEIPLRH